MSSTTTTTAACPPEEELEQFADEPGLSGRAAADHVLRCRRCRETVERIRRENAFLAEHAPAIRGSSGTRSTDPPRELPGYVIERALGSGGQGVVYEAMQTATRRRVAIKMLREGLFASERQRHRFEREVDVLASLRHRNIVTVFDRGRTENGLDYVVMEFIQGRPVTEHFHEAEATRNAARPKSKERISRCLAMLAKVADAVQHAHAVGVMHRDLKPGNILVDDEGEPRIIDFGLARTETGDRGPSPTLTREFMGTCAYASPEQFAGNPDHLTVATDVYSLGVLIFESLTGTFPYPVDGSTVEVAKHARETEPRRPSSIRSDIPGEVDTIVLKALAKDPGRRYTTAGELAADIRAFLSGRPIAARRDHALYRLRKQVVRHRVVAFAAAVLFVTLALWIASMARKNRELIAEQSRSSRAISDSNLRQSRLLTLAGNTVEAEQLLWPEFFSAGGKPDDPGLGFNSEPQLLRATWALFEAYNRSPRLMVGSAGASDAHPYFSPDGGVVSAVSGHGSVRRWSITGEQLPAQATPPLAEKSRVWASPDGDYLVAVPHGELEVIDRHSGRVVATREVGSREIREVVFSHDGSALLYLDSRGVMTVCRTVTLEPICDVETGHPSSVPAGISGDGRLVAAWSQAGDVLAWRDPWSDAPVAFRSRSSTEAPPAEDERGMVAISPDGGWLAAVSGTRVYVWPVADPACVFVLAGHQATVEYCQFSEDSRRLLTAASDRSIRVWDVGSEVEAAILSPTEGARPRAVFSPDGRLISSIDSSGRISVWEAEKSPWGRFSRPWSGEVPCVRISNGGHWAVTSCSSGECIVWDLSTQRTVARLDAAAPPAIAACVSGDGKRVVIRSPGLGGSLLQWDIPAPPRVLVEGIGAGAAVLMSPNSDSVAYTEYDKLCLFDLKSCERRVVGSHRSHINQLAFSPNGALLASAGADGECSVLDISSGDRVRLVGHEGEIRAVCFSPDSTVVATAGDDLTIRLWDARSGSHIRTVRGIAAAIRSLAFHPEGKVLFSCSSSPVITVWDPATGVELASMYGHEAGVISLDVSPDGRTLLSGARNGEVGVWELARFQRHLRGNAAAFTQRAKPVP